MNVHVLPAGPIATNAYLLTAPACGEAILIDAPGGIWREIEALLAEEHCRLTELWLTHGHWDHIMGAPEVVAASGVRVGAHPADRVLIETPEVQRAFLMPGIDLAPVRPDFWFERNEHREILSENVEVRHVPGHSPGNVLFYFAKSNLAFVGDVIFAGSTGRTDLPGGSFEELERSIRQQVYTLPEDTRLFSGHGPATTVREEKLHNPYVSVSS